MEAETGIEKGARVLIPRFGAVLSRRGGALAQMLPPFRLGLGGRLASGKQWFSWIHMDDLVRALLFVAENSKVAGVVNMCSPEPVRNLELTRTLAKVLKRPAILPVPGIVLKLALGGSAEIALKGQRVLPGILEQTGGSSKRSLDLFFLAYTESGSCRRCCFRDLMIWKILGIYF